MNERLTIAGVRPQLRRPLVDTVDEQETPAQCPARHATRVGVLRRVVPASEVVHRRKLDDDDPLTGRPVTL